MTIIALLLVTFAPAPFENHRALKNTEQALVGRWRTEFYENNELQSYELTLNKNKSFIDSAGKFGRWKLTNKRTLILTPADDSPLRCPHEIKFKLKHKNSILSCSSFDPLPVVYPDINSDSTSLTFGRQ